MLVAKDRDVAAAVYVHIGLSYIDILGALAINHRIMINMRTLIRSLNLSGGRQIIKWRLSYKIYIYLGTNGLPYNLDDAMTYIIYHFIGETGPDLRTRLIF